MRRETAIKLLREMRRYSNHACTRPHPTGFVIKQAIFPLITKAEKRICESEANVKTARVARTLWVKVKDIKSEQRSLTIRRMVYQLRRHPIKKLPMVVALPGGKFMIWDGNHRATAAAMLGCKKLRCEQIRNISKSRAEKIILDT